MKRLIPVLLAAQLMLSGCGCPEPPVEPQQCPAPVSSERSSAPEVSSEVESATSSETASSEAASSETVSSESVSSEPVSSETVSSEVTVLPPVESEAIPELACPLASSQPFSQEQAPTSSAPAASSAASEYVVPEDERPMTDAEVDALIAGAIAYAESKGMTWYDEFSLSNDIIGYNPPGHSEWGYRACKETVLYNIDDLYETAITANFYVPGGSISYKIEKGRIEPFEGWFIYVLY